MRGKVVAAAMAATVLIGAADMSEAVGRQTEVLQVSCEASEGVEVLLEGLCSGFMARLEAAYPALHISEGDPAMLTLVVEDNTPGMFRARIDQTGKRGTPMGTARRGTPLDDVARQRLLDTLIEQLDL